MRRFAVGCCGSSSTGGPTTPDVFYSMESPQAVLTDKEPEGIEQGHVRACVMILAKGLKAAVRPEEEWGSYLGRTIDVKKSY